MSDHLPWRMDENPPHAYETTISATLKKPTIVERPAPAPFELADSLEAARRGGSDRNILSSDRQGLQLTKMNDASPPHFDENFRAGFRELVRWRRDVRRFRRDPVDRALFRSLLDLARSSPSVGNCQPWRFVIVDSPDRRAEVKASFERANARALGGYEGEARELYAKLRLEGLDAAPVHFAAFADEGTEAGAGLGRRTMPETLHYSVATAIQTLWLAARAEGLGLGWISIIEPEVVTRTLETPASWKLVGYFCLGWPEEEHADPELERRGWQGRKELAELILQR